MGWIERAQNWGLREKASGTAQEAVTSGAAEERMSFRQEVPWGQSRQAGLTCRVVGGFEVATVPRGMSDTGTGRWYKILTFYTLGLCNGNLPRCMM